MEELSFKQILFDRTHYFDCLKSLNMDNDGEIEDCLKIAKELL